MQIKEPGVRSSYSDGRPELYVGMPCDIEVLLGDGGVVWPSPIDADAEPGRPAGVLLQSAVKEAGGQLEQVLEMEKESIVSSVTVLINAHLTCSLPIARTSSYSPTMNSP
jgi:hypothetical protein